MAYDEIKKRNGNLYYYRAHSLRIGEKIAKIRKYLGKNLDNNKLEEKRKKADEEILKFLKEKRKEILGKLKEKIIKILKEEGIKKAGIFGSFARGEQKKGSDIDIVIEPAKNMGFEFAGLSFKLSEELGRKVDLVTYKSLHPLLKSSILKEEVRII